MILVQKPPTFNLAPVVPYAHRRNPSAPPAVVVQPTKTPGLLSISKPARTSPQRYMPSQQRSYSTKQAVKPKQQQPLMARAPALLNPAEISNKKPASLSLQAPVTPSPQQRGRGSKYPKEKSQSKRTPSPSPVRGKHSRQPSPPVEAQTPLSSQAEVQILSLNHFDPFLANSDPSVSQSQTQTPSKPSRRRPQRQSPSPAVSESIPVPRVVKPKPQSMSRSEPELSHMPSRGPRTFRICDDMTEAADLTEPESPGVPTPPATPLRKQAFADKTYLVNAPISTESPAGLSFGYPSPPSSLKGRKHRRAPSEGVFHMSSDEDVSSGPGGIVLNQNLFGLPRKATATGKMPTTPSPSLSRVGGAAIARELNDSPMNGQKTAGYFASSLFQNSPSPDELPDPLLF